MDKETLIKEYVSLKGLNPQQTEKSMQYLQTLPLEQLNTIIEKLRSAQRRSDYLFDISTEQPKSIGIGEYERKIHDLEQKYQEQYQDLNPSDPYFEIKSKRLEMNFLYLRMEIERLIFLNHQDFPFAIMPESYKKKYLEFINNDIQIFGNEIENLLVEGWRIPNKEYQGEKPNSEVRKAATEVVEKLASMKQLPSTFWNKLANMHMFRRLKPEQNGYVSRESKDEIIKNRNIFVAAGHQIAILRMVDIIIHNERDMMETAKKNKNLKAIEKFKKHIELSQKLRETFKF